MKKIVSLLLALTLIIGLFATVGTVSAEIASGKTTAVYHYNFNNAANLERIWLTSDLWGTTGMAVTVSFDYYLSGDAQLGVYKYTESYAFADNTTGSEKLQQGMNTFTYTTDNFEFAGWGADLLFACIENRTEGGNADLYIWNVKVIRDGVDVTKISPAGSSITSELTNYEEVLNSMPVHHISFNETPDLKGYWLSADFWETNGMSVTVSFDYYLTGNAKLGVYKYDQDAALKDDVIGTEILQQGMNTFTYTTDNFYFGEYWCASLLYPYIAKRGDGGYAELYIWNVKVIRNGQNVTNVGYDKNDDSITSETMTYGEAFNMMNTYHHIDFNETSASKGVCLVDAAGYWDTTGTVTVSFDYYLSGTANLGVYSWTEYAALNDVTTGTQKLSQGRNTFTYTTESYSAGGWADTLLCPYIENRGIVANADLYIWNVKVTRNGLDVTNVGYVNDESITVETFNSYADVANEIEEVYEFDFSSKALFALSDTENSGWYNSNTAVTITFDYYLANAKDGELVVQDNATAGGYNDVATKDNKLYAGRHTFTFTTDNFTHNARGCIAVGIKLSDETVASNAKLYIINPKIIVKPSEAYENDKFGVGYNVAAFASEYNAIPNKGDSNNDGVLNVLDFIKTSKYLENNNVMIDRKNINTDDNGAIDLRDLINTKKILLGVK